MTAIPTCASGTCACGAVANRNERDADAGDGRAGLAPAGNLARIHAADSSVARDTPRWMGLTGRGAVDIDVPIPAFVDTNRLDGRFSALQATNRHAIVALDSMGIADLPAGAANLAGIAVDADGALAFDPARSDRVCEPGAVAG